MDGFKELMVQGAIYLFSKPKYDMSAFPPIKSLTMFVDKMKDSAKKRK